MRIAYLVIGAAGHLLPPIPLIRSLQRLGHQVTLFAPEWCRTVLSDSEFQGYESRIFAKPIKPRLEDQQTATWPHAWPRVMAEEIAVALPSLCQMLRHRRCEFVISDAFTYAGILAAESLGLPCAIASVSYLAGAPLERYGEQFGGPQFVREAFYPDGSGFAEVMKPVWRKYHLPPRSFYELRNLRTPATICLLPKQFHPAAEEYGASALFVDPEIGSRQSFPEFESSGGECDVYLNLGTLFPVDRTVVATCFAVFRELDIRVIFSCACHEEIRKEFEIPPNVELLPHVNQPAVLRQTKVFISHAGTGGVLESIYTHTPLISLPTCHEHMITAWRAEELRCGLAILRENLTPDRLRRSLEQILNDATFRTKCMLLTKHMRESSDSLEHACANVLKLTL